MNTFPCSSCKKPIQAADDLVGKSILCPHCGLTTTVANAAITTTNSLATYPSSTGVTTADVFEVAEQARRRREADERDPHVPSVLKSGRWFPSLIHILIIVAIIAILVGLFVPSVEKVRHAAARTQSMNNLKQIALAVHSFHDANKRLPFNGSDLVADDKPYSAMAIGGNDRSGSWAFQILPFLDGRPLFDRVDQDRVVPAFLCPGRSRPLLEAQGGAWTDYFYNNYLNDPKQASKPDGADMRRMLVGITDGTSNTVLVGHGNVRTDQYHLDANVTLCTNIFRGGTTGTMRAGNNGEVTPGGVTLQRDSANAPTIGSWGGPFNQGALISMADGTVRMFPYTVQTFGEFLTPTGGEAVVMPDT